MSKHTKRAKAKSTKEGWPLVVYVWIIGLGLIGYLLGEIALATQPHPYHWLAALMGAVIGGFAGWLWYRWRGDVV